MSPTGGLRSICTHAIAAVLWLLHLKYQAATLLSTMLTQDHFKSLEACSLPALPARC